MAGQEFIMQVRYSRSVFIILAVLGLYSCAVVGPRSITSGRGDYAEVINRTEDEQILNVIVRQRYNETFGMMTVASITSNLKFKAQAGANVGIGDSDSYDANLVPLSSGVAYEENPTISYVPLGGEDFTRRMLSPVTIDEWVLLSGHSRVPGHMLALAVRRLNGLRSPLLGDAPVSPEFLRFLELYTHLRRAYIMEIVQSSTSGYFWEIVDYAPAYVDDVREFLNLLSIEVAVDGSDILLPMRQEAGRSSSEVHLHPRSALDVLRTFGAGVELPPAHVEAGIVEPLKAEIPEAMSFMTILSSEKRSDNATVQVLFRDHWFYIDATDTKSKLSFAFLRSFIGMRLADTGALKSPVITLQAN
jgi:hypothetical protein